MPAEKLKPDLTRLRPEAEAEPGSLVAEVEALSIGTDPDKEKATKILRRLAGEYQHKRHIEDALGVEPLIGLVRDGNDVLKEEAAGALNNLSFKNDETKRQIVDKGGIEPLVALAKGGKEDQRTQAAGALRNVASLAQGQKPIADAGGIAAMVSILKDTKAKESEIDMATGTLLGLSVDMDNKTKIADAQCLLDLVHLVRVGTDNQKELAAGVLLKLAAVANNTTQIREAGALDPLLELVRAGSPALKEVGANALWALSSNDPSGRIKMVIEMAGGIEPRCAP